MTDAHLFVPSPLFATQPCAGTWFVFRQRELLVTTRYELPSALAPSALGLSLLRTQYLGTLAGEGCFSAEVASDTAAPADMQFLDLRRLYGRLREPLMGVAARAVQVMYWDRTHQFCGACGARTAPHQSARARICVAADCGLEQYPRVSPAMIVAVERGEELLLARSPHFPAGVYSTLAGFVDPGESVEQAVHREVFEETGVKIDNLRYYASQSWPFPGSLMLGFWADYVSGEIVPEPGEIEDAAFFHVDRLPPMFPGRVSVGQQLVADFCRRHGRPFPGDLRG